MQRSEKVIVEEQKLVQKDELRPLTMQEIRWVYGRDGRKKKILTTKVLREPKTRTLPRALTSKLRALNTTVLYVPMGMQRARENKTTLNRKTNRILWQVEWIKLDGSPSMSLEQGTERSLFKVMDDVPLYRAHKYMMEEQARRKNPAAIALKKISRNYAQNSMDSKWLVIPEMLQEPGTGNWISREDIGEESGVWPSEQEKMHLELYDFYLASPVQRSDEPKAVSLLEPRGNLENILAGAKVLEFPTVYVLGRGQTLPPGFVIRAKEMSEARGRRFKRKDSPEDEKQKGRFTKRRRGGELEDGEIRSDGEGDDGNGEVADFVVIKEESLGEEDDDEEDDSPTSSSGSDTSDEDSDDSE